MDSFFFFKLFSTITLSAFSQLSWAFFIFSYGFLNWSSLIAFRACSLLGKIDQKLLLRPFVFSYVLCMPFDTG